VDLKREETLARQMVRKMETDGSIPKMTMCTIKMDSAGSVPAIRIVLKHLPLGEIHPASKFFLVSMAVHRIRFTVKKYSGVEAETMVTVIADPDVFPEGEGDRGKVAVLENPDLRIGNELRRFNEEYEEDNTTLNPGYVRNFSKLIQAVDERVQCVLTMSGIPSRAYRS
jgi:hypothetical protein